MKEVQEPKYDATPSGNIINRKTGRIIPDDEPVFILRARDIHAVAAISYYSELCAINAHADFVDQRIECFEKFSELHPDRMQEPGKFHSA